MASGFRIGVEFVVAIGVATALGWAIDRWLGTRPWGIIVLFFLGVGAGMLNVYRAVAGIRVPVGYRQPGRRSSRRRAQTKDKWDDDENSVAIEIHPLEQFEIQRIIPMHIGGIDISYTNSALMMTIVVVSDHRADRVRHPQGGAGARPMAIGRRDDVRVRRRHGGHQCRPWRAAFFPFVFTLFVFILFANLFGLVP